MLLVDATLFFNAVDVPGDAGFVRRVKVRGLFGDEPGFVSAEQRLIEGRPAEGRVRFDDLVEGASVLFAERDGFAGAEIRATTSLVFSVATKMDGRVR